jgi:hypothetical protein
MKRKTIARFGKAYATLNTWEWDEYIGKKPEGFDDLKNYDRDKTVITKNTIITPYMNFIHDLIGEKNCNRYWWKYELHRNYLKWLIWWYTQDYIR